MVRGCVKFHIMVLGSSGKGKLLVRRREISCRNGITNKVGSLDYRIYCILYLTLSGPYADVCFLKRFVIACFVTPVQESAHISPFRLRYR